MEAKTFAKWAGIDAGPEVIESLREGWTIYPLKVGGIEVAAACMSGSEIHFAVSPEWRGRVIAKQRMRDFLAPLFDIYGFLTTRSAPDKVRHRFLERMGFSLTWNDGINDHYFLTELPFGKQKRTVTLLGRKPSA